MRITMFLFVAFSVTVFLYGETSKRAEALKINQAPKLDGKLDEAFWKTAESLGYFQIWSKSDKGKATKSTEVRLAYDNTWLYIGLKCNNPLQKLVLSPKVKDHDGSVNTDESVEIFITSDKNRKTYYHFMLTCFNVKAEQRILNGVKERKTWNLPWRSATMITDKGWTAEVAIPIYLFLEHGDFDHIRLNIARNQRQPFMDSCNVITHEIMEHSILCPVIRSYHEPESFAPLASLKPDKIQVPFLVAMENPEVKPYFIKNGNNFYGVEVIIKGTNPKSGEVELAVTDYPAGGKEKIVRKKISIKGLTSKNVSILVPAPAPCERSVKVEIRDASTGEPLQSATIENPSCLKIMDAYLDRNYYTSEEVAIAVVEIGMPQKTLEGMTAAVEINGKNVGSTSAASEAIIKFPVKIISIGTHHVKIILKRTDGAQFCSIDTKLIKRTPKPGREVKIDQINRIILKDGKPFFPFGPVMGGITPENEADYKNIAAVGCNTFFQWCWTSKVASAYLTPAKKYGLQLVSRLETGWLSPKEAQMDSSPKMLKLLSKEELKTLMTVRAGELRVRGYLMNTAARRHPSTIKTEVFREYCDKNMPVMEKTIKSLMNADNFLAYNSFDEPYSKRILDMTKTMESMYRLTQKTDGYHPVMLNYSSHIPEGDEYVTCCDILCTDPYWVPDGSASLGVRRTPNWVSKIVALTNHRAEKFRKAVWIIPVGWTWSGIRRAKRILTPAEQDCQNFLAIIHGAKGLFWFCYPMPDVVWNTLTNVIHKIKVMSPMAVQPKVKQTINYLWASEPQKEYRKISFDPFNDKYPDIQGRVFRDPDGGLVLLAANSSYFPVTATFSVNGLSGKVGRIFSDDTLPVKNGVFIEKLKPFATRAYRLGNDLKEPVTLTISSLRPEKIPPPETCFTNNVRVGKKNVFPNPSFEIDSTPTLPDYYFGNARVVNDPSKAKFDNKCLKLSNHGKTVFGRVYWESGPRHNKDTAYVWSFWAKGAKGKEKIWVRTTEQDYPFRATGPKTFYLTTEWKRYHIPMTISARGKPQFFDIRLLSKGDAWIDGLQLEKGYKPTEFEK